MDGYIGERARRRRRNFILFFIFLMIILIIYYFLPLLKSSEIKPNDYFFPNEQEIKLPMIQTTIEELELQIFDKEQKIIFRNKQIKKLKDEVKILTLKNKNFEKKIDSFSSNKDLMGKNQFNDLKKFKDINLQLMITNEDLLKEIIKFENDASILNKEFKDIFKNNLKVKNLNKENNQKINELQNIIKEQNLIIKLLKDRTPHGS